MQDSIRRLAAVLMLCFIGIAGGLTYWQVIYADNLTYGDHNPRLARQEKEEIQRGQSLDRNGNRLAFSQPSGSTTRRVYADPTLAQTVGYFTPDTEHRAWRPALPATCRGDVPANPFDALMSGLMHRPRVGSNLILTIDSRVQQAAAASLGGNRGAVVALDPRTGAILAMVSVPNFDPNRLDEDWASLSKRQDKHLINRATQGLYTPGSVFKIVTATAAVDLGLVDLNKSYTDTQDLVVDGFRIANDNHKQVSKVTFVDDFAFSCNVQFAKTGLSLGTRPLPVGDNIPDPPWNHGIDESRRLFLEYARRFGLEGQIPFDIATSVSRVGKENLSKVELANSAFGQGELQVTPLLMALGAATIANGGKMAEPYLVQEIRDPSGFVQFRRDTRTLRDVMTPESAQTMNRLMKESVREGYASPAAIPGVAVGGKTGSAETGPGQKTHSWFIGYAPADNPTVAVAVIMENRGSGSDFATPAGKQVMQAALGR